LGRRVFVDNYIEVKKIWDDIFKKLYKEDEFESKPLDPNELEEGVIWLSEESTKKILDIGCGRGTLIFRSLYHGVNYGVGLDISNSAIEICKKRAEILEITSKAQFVNKGLLDASFEKDEFDGIILSNILDLLTPFDMERHLLVVKRILKKGSRMLLKFNDHMDDEIIISRGSKRICENYYIESNGQHFINFTDKKLEDTISKIAHIKDYERIYFGNEIYNRLILAIKK
jgi:SAM-dependent methyltransferase